MPPVPPLKPPGGAAKPPGPRPPPGPPKPAPATVGPAETIDPSRAVVAVCSEYAAGPASPAKTASPATTAPSRAPSRPGRVAIAMIPAAASSPAIRMTVRSHG